jgi:hypothetical protein
VLPVEPAQAAHPDGANPAQRAGREKGGAQKAEAAVAEVAQLSDEEAEALLLQELELIKQGTRNG